MHFENSRSKPVLFCVLLLALVSASACNRTSRVQDNIAAGKQALEARDYPRAILLFKKEVRQKPQDAEPVYQLSRAYLATGDAAVAVGLLRKAIQLDTKHLQARKLLTDLLVGSRNTEILKEAKQIAQAALVENPNDSELLEILGSAEIRLGDRQPGEEHLRQALEKFPRNIKAAMSLSSLKLVSGDRDGAEKVLRAVAAADPESPQPSLVLARFYRMTGRSQDAEQEFKRALQRNPDNEPLLLSYANMLRDLRRIGEAEPLYKRLSTAKNAELRPIYGAFLASQGRIPESTAEFRRLSEAEPKNRIARSRLISSLNAEGKRAEAASLLDAALKKNNRDVQALLQLAELHILDRKAREAQSALSEVLRFDPNSAPAHHLLARAYAMQGDSRLYRQELAETVRLNPQNVFARSELAGTFIDDGNAKTAISLLDAGPEWQRRHSRAILERTRALFSSGEFSKAREEITKGLAHERTPGLLLQKARLEMQEKQYERARASAQEALQRNPGDASAVALIARSHLLQGDSARAKAAIVNYAAAHPSSAAIQAFAGEWLFDQKYTVEGRKLLESALALNPGFLAAAVTLAQVELRESNVEAARKLLEGVLTKAPRSTTALTMLAELEAVSGQTPKAVEYFRKLVEINGKDHSSMNNLAYLLLEINPDEALQYAQRAKELVPESPTVDDTLGWALYKKGVYSSAVRHLQSAAKSGSALHSYHLAMAYAKVGDQGRGKQALAAALTANPNLPEAALAKRALEQTRH